MKHSPRATVSAISKCVTRRPGAIAAAEHRVRFDTGVELDLGSLHAAPTHARASTTPSHSSRWSPSTESRTIRRRSIA
jgi:hypothetical protein